MFRRWLTGFLLGLLLSLGIGAASTAQAQTTGSDSGGCALSAEEVGQLTGNKPILFVPDISIPGFSAGSPIEINGSTIGNYIRGIFIIFIWSVTVLAVVMVIFGGIKWVAAAGNPAQINDAKDVVTNAIIGLVIALTSFLMLRLINPDFTSFSPLSPNKVSRCSLALLKQVVGQAGTVDSCSRHSLIGEPSQVCFTDPSRPCLDANLNDLIVQNSNFTSKASHHVSVDPVIMKALVMGEAALRGSDTVVSGPTSGRACGSNSPRCKLKGTAYGIIQANHEVVVRQMQKLEGSVAPACDGDEKNWRADSGSLAAGCAAVLDNGLDGIKLQLQIMASELQDTTLKLKDNPTMMAAAYHLGQGDATAYLQGDSPQNESSSAATSYLRSFNSRYRQICTTAIQSEERPPKEGF